LTQTPRLDSFLRESARLNPLDALSVRRKTLTPYTISSTPHTHIPAGNWICVPQSALMLDSAHYQHAETFDGFRFVCAGEATTPAGRMGTETKNDTAGGSRKERGSKFTDVDWKFPFWGLGKRACPGRFYASALLKVTLARLLLQYDFRLPTAAGDGERPLSFTWRSAVVPRQGVRLMVRRRGSAP